jgi:hypothetical protein
MGGNPCHQKQKIKNESLVHPCRSWSGHFTQAVAPSGFCWSFLLVIFAGSHGGAVRPLNQPTEDDRVKHLKKHPKL